MKVVIVSVSLFAGHLHLGHLVFRNFLLVARGETTFFLKLTFNGSFTGKSFSGTGTIPHLTQYIIGIGEPQYLCLEIFQSRKA